MAREKDNFREVYSMLLEKYQNNIIFAEQACEILNCKRTALATKYKFLKADENSKDGRYSLAKIASYLC